MSYSIRAARNLLAHFSPTKTPIANAVVNTEEISLVFHTACTGNVIKKIHKFETF